LPKRQALEEGVAYDSWLDAWGVTVEQIETERPLMIAMIDIDALEELPEKPDLT